MMTTGNRTRSSSDNGGGRGSGLLITALLLMLVLLVWSGLSSTLNTDAPSKAAATSPQSNAKVFAAAPTKTTPPATKTNEELSRDYTINSYRAYGLTPPSELDLKSIAVQICSDIRAGGEGSYFHTTYGKPGSKSAGTAASLNYAYATVTECNLTSTFWEGNSARSRLKTATYQAPKFIIPEGDSTAPSRPEAPSRSTAGYRVRCIDGTHSNAGGKQGACSWHGGVDR